MTTRRALLDRFYRQLATLERQCGGKRCLSQCHGRMGWPRRGVYFFFEAGELREDGATQRVVRVGTHALRPSKSTLWGRLAQHRGSQGGAMPGGGNHRGSIFRGHVGSALLASGRWRREVPPSWRVGATAGAGVRKAEYALECAASKHIGAMPLLWLEVADAPGSDSDRGTIEAGAISLLSNLDRDPIDASSTRWLGRRARCLEVAESGLWNVDHVRDQPSGQFLEVFERWLGSGLGKRTVRI